MFSALKKGWLWLLAMAMCSVPSLAFASTINVSGFLGTFILLVVIVVLACFALWAIRYWTPEMIKVASILPKVLTFIVVAIACIWIIVILAGLFGVHII